MRVVAIGALHQAFGNAVVIRKGELSLDRLVAAVAEVRFGLLQQAVMKPPCLVRQLRKLEEVGLWRRHGLTEVPDLVYQVR